MWCDGSISSVLLRTRYHATVVSISTFIILYAYLESVCCTPVKKRAAEKETLERGELRNSSSGVENGTTGGAGPESEDISKILALANGFSQRKCAVVRVAHARNTRMYDCALCTTVEVVVVVQVQNNVRLCFRNTTATATVVVVVQHAERVPSAPLQYNIQKYATPSSHLPSWC